MTKASTFISEFLDLVLIRKQVYWREKVVYILTIKCFVIDSPPCTSSFINDITTLYPSTTCVLEC